MPLTSDQRTGSISNRRSLTLDQRHGSISSRRSFSIRKSVTSVEEALPQWSDIEYLCERPEVAISEVKKCNLLMGRVHNVASATIQSLNTMISSLTTVLANERKNNLIEEPASFAAMLDLLEEFVARSASLSANIEQRMLPLTANWVSLQTSMVSYDAALANHADTTKRHEVVIDLQRKKCNELFQQLDGRLGGSSLPSILQRRRSSQVSKLTRIDRAYRASLEYEFTLSAARTEQRQWRYTEVPGILTALQEMYERRLQNVDQACESIVEALVPHTGGFRVNLPVPSKFGKKFLAESLNASKRTEDKPVSSARFIYDLRLTLSDLIERRRICLLSDRENEQTGQLTLTEMVIKQYGTYPTLEVPLIFHRLMEAISHLDPNVSLDGAFRTTPRLSELDTFREYLLSDQWNPHITPETEMVNLYAYQLKSWLRELPYPVIPSELYIRCIELGRGPIGKSENVQIQLKEITESLPDVNFRMLKSLILLLRRCIASNPVSGEALITVFAPCLMRNPIDNDPGRMLADLSAERQFLSAVIKYWSFESESPTPQNDKATPPGDTTIAQDDKSIVPAIAS